MKISYEYKDLIALSAAGTYRNWDAKEKYSLYMKPACEINFSADFRPITGLNINLGYDYIGRTKVEGIKAAAVSDLHAGASYNVFKGVSGSMPGLIISSIRNTSIIWAILQKVLTSWRIKLQLLDKTYSPKRRTNQMPILLLPMCNITGWAFLLFLTKPPFPFRL